MGSLLVWLLPMILIAVTFHSREGKSVVWGEPQEKSLATPCQPKDNALFDIERALQKGKFRSFTEKGWGPIPEDSPSCVPEHMCKM